MLYTNLNHIESAGELTAARFDNERMVVICGDMDEPSINLYRLAEKLVPKMDDVRFFDFEYLNPESEELQIIAQSQGITDAPVVIFYYRGQPVYIEGRISSERKFKEVIKNCLINI